MKKVCLIAVIVFFFLFVGFVSAALVENSTWQQNLTASDVHDAIAFGDIDNDGDLDMIQTGCGEGTLLGCDSAGKTRVYVNNRTSLVESNQWQQNLTTTNVGSIAFGDIDNDGDLDLILTSTYARIYINNGTTFEESSTWQQEVLLQSNSNSINLGDIDNDGDLDLLMVDMGNSPGNSTFLNNGTAFVGNANWGQETRQDSRVSSALIDIDNDFDLDSISIGYNYFSIYISNQTTLELSSVWGSGGGLDHASLAVGDVDNDADMDVFVMGLSGACGDADSFLENNGSALWRNSTFEDSLTGLFYGSASFGDYNNNGYLDLVINGQCAGTPYSYIYDGNSSGFTGSNENINSSQSGSVVWADLNNDNNLDLVNIRRQEIYINNITTPNTPPTSPTSFSSSYSNREIKLGWLNGSDDETSSDGLYYNLMIGNSTNNHTIVSGVYGGQGDVSGGGGIAFGYFGNMMQRKNLTLKVDRLDAGTTYYWYVQTIDTALKAGNWSDVQSFTTPDDMEKPNITLNSPADNYNSSSYIITFNVTVSDNVNLTNVSLYGNWTASGWHLNETNSSGINNTNYIFIKNLTSDGDGSYTWQIKAEDNSSNTQTSAIIMFTIDTTAPNISSEVGSPTIIYTNTNIILNATITDALVGIESVWISINSSNSFTNYTVSSSTSVYSFLLDSGNYSKNQNVSWRYYANDSAGNKQTGSLQSFVIANSVPVLGGIPDNSTNEDVIPPDKFYNLSLYVSDTDNDNLTFYVQSQSNESLINCSVYNISISYYLNCTTPLANQSGSSEIIVNVTDGSTWDNDTFIVTVTAVNDVPWLTAVNLTAEAGNLTNETLTGFYTFNDVESSSETANETKWYKNNTEVSSLVNFTSISSGNTTKDENWTFSARVYDGTNWSNWYNSSKLTILNSAPDLSTMPNQSWIINSNLTLNLSSYFSDIDNDNLNYTNTTVANITITINQTTSVVSLVPDIGWNGTRYVIFTANDSELAADSNNITLTVYKPTINFTEFDGSTTNFTNLTDFVNISVVIEKAEHGKISFSSVTLNSSSININEYVNISNNRIEVNSSSLSVLNESATLYFYNLTYNNPRVLIDGAVCPASICTEISYNGGTFIFTVTSFSVYSSGETPTDDGVNGGGGGGTPSYWTLTSNVNNEQFKKGYTKELSVKHRLKISVNNTYHYIGVVELSNKNITINVTSEPQQAILLVGDEKKFELTNDTYYDLLVKLNSINKTSNKANLTVKSIYEEVVEEEEDEKEEISEEKKEDEKESQEKEEKADLFELAEEKIKEFWFLIVIIVVLIIIFLINKFYKKFVRYKQWKKYTLVG